jgi:hypothetical protein
MKFFKQVPVNPDRTFTVGRDRKQNFQARSGKILSGKVAKKIMNRSG